MLGVWYTLQECFDLFYAKWLSHRGTSSQQSDTALRILFHLQILAVGPAQMQREESTGRWHYNFAMLELHNNRHAETACVLFLV